MSEGSIVRGVQMRSSDLEEIKKSWIKKAIMKCEESLEKLEYTFFDKHRSVTLI